MEVLYHRVAMTLLKGTVNMANVVWPTASMVIDFADLQQNTVRLTSSGPVVVPL